MKGKVIIMFDNKNLTPEEKAARKEKLNDTCETVVTVGSAVLISTCALYMGIHCIKAIAGTEDNNTNSAFKVAGGIN